MGSMMLCLRNPSSFTPAPYPEQCDAHASMWAARYRPDSTRAAVQRHQPFTRCITHSEPGRRPPVAVVAAGDCC